MILKKTTFFFPLLYIFFEFTHLFKFHVLEIFANTILLLLFKLWVTHRTNQILFYKNLLETRFRLTKFFCF